jgi:hypothetical protein
MTSLRRTVVMLLLVDEALLLLGVLRYPAVLQEGGLLGILAGSVILGVYGFLALFSPIAPGRADPGPVRRGLILGLVGGAGLSIDLVSSYFITRDPSASAAWSLLVYGLFFLLLLCAGVWGAASTGRFKAGFSTALWCMVIALLLWFCAEFAAYYLFAGTEVGAAFIGQEMAADFARSGATDYQGFVLADFYGAGFFHLLLGLGFAAGLGALGALGGLLTWRLTGRPRSRAAK